VKTKEFVELEKRLLPNFPGFTVKGKLLFISPVQNTIRGFYFEPSAFTGNDFYVNVFFLPLCVPAKCVHFTFGHRIGAEKRWRESAPNFDTNLTSEMLKEVPFLSSLKTPKDVAKALEPLTKRLNPHCLEAFAYTLIQAEETGAAAEALDTLLRLADMNVVWQQEIASRARLIRNELLKNPEEAQKQLAVWELETALNLGLENVSPGISQF
jgi:hypothetical protein